MISYTTAICAGTVAGGTLIRACLSNKPLQGLLLGAIHFVIPVVAENLFGKVVSRVYLGCVATYMLREIYQKRWGPLKPAKPSDEKDSSINPLNTHEDKGVVKDNLLNINDDMLSKLFRKKAPCDTVTASMVSQFEINIFCYETYPCTHYCMITLIDKRQYKGTLDGPTIKKLMEIIEGKKLQTNAKWIIFSLE